VKIGPVEHQKKLSQEIASRLIIFKDKDEYNKVFLN